MLELFLSAVARITMTTNLLLVIAGIVTLVGGGELLVRGAAALARTLGISAMVVGLTVVAYGTSAPEFFVGVMAAYRGNPAICSGNVVGSNILNVLLVLGATAVICPIRASAGFVRREVPIMVGVSLLLWPLVGNGSLSRANALLLVGLLAAYTVLTVWIARREKKAVVREFEQTQPGGARSVVVNLVIVVVGLVLLWAGSRLFVSGAVGIAEWFGVSEVLIGLTLVAMGTSVPELVASLIAARRGHPDLCLGNIIGSSIYNILGIAGVSGVVRALPFERGMLTLHVPVMVLSALALWFAVWTGQQISRREGAMLLVMYAAYFGLTLHRYYG